MKKLILIICFLMLPTLSFAAMKSGAGNKAPDDADYLVGTANGSLSAEIVVGATPGGSLGGTWATPTIDDLFILNSAADTMTGNLTITSTDPAIILDEAAATDTDFWIANISDSAGDDDDTFQIGDGTTPGTNPFLTINTSGNVGIGTTTPTKKLDVNGAIICGGTASAQSFIDSGLVVNESGLGTAADDFRAETGTNANAFVVDASANEVLVGVDFVVDTSDLFVDVSTGYIGIGTASPSAELDVNSDILRLRTSKTPATAGATGNAGDICWDADYVYICVATDTWKRAAISTW